MIFLHDATIERLNNILSRINNELEMAEYINCSEISDSYDNFADYYKNHSKVKSQPDSELIKLSGIEKSYYYQIKKGSKKPSRDKVIRLCIGAGMSLQETIHALELNEDAIFYPRNRRDIIISVAIKQNASVIDTNLLLDKYNEKPLA